MLKLVSIISIIFCATATNYVLGIQIDNQLTTAKNDCFERLVLEAMIPLERSFRSIETNSVRVCENLCMVEGDRCQTFSLGINAKGNGTCQLSSVRIDASSGRRPVGTIYDPDFDIYQRQANCVITDTTNPETTFTSGIPTYSTLPNKNVPNTPISTSTNTISSSYPSSISTGTSLNTIPITNSRPTTTQIIPSVNPPSSQSIEDTKSPKDQYSQPNYPSTIPNTFSTDEKYAKPSSHIYESGFPTTMQSSYNTNERYPPTPAYLTNRYPPTPGTNPSEYPPNTEDKLHFYYELNPTYTYPMLYEKNYPNPNNDKDAYPSVYAQNVPTVTVHYVRPTTITSSPISTTLSAGDAPTTYHGSTQSTLYRPTDSYGSNRDRNPPHGNGQYGPNSMKPTVHTNYNNYRPDHNALDNDHYYHDRMKDKHYYGSVEPIQTYFNPDDYYPVMPKACFRRALAGKRISKHWVRRTLTCERVEDCQYECGHEKRFTCEGFNYKIDPSGHGQGVCELIDVPLSEMDLYTRHNGRDDNLIYHPDYDYYERDRNACRPSGCTNCAVKVYEPTAIDHYRPTTYRPPSNDFRPYEKPGYYPHDSPDYGYVPDYMRPYDERPPMYEPRPPPFIDKPYDRPGPSDSVGYRPSSYDLDRYDSFKPIEISRPGYHEVIIPIDSGYGGGDKQSQLYPDRPGHKPSGYIYIEDYRYNYKPFRPNDNSYEDKNRPGFTSAAFKPTEPPFRYPPPGPSIYLDRDPIPPVSQHKPSHYLPEDSHKHWGSYGGVYGGSSYNSNKHTSDYWGLQNDHERKDDHFNYFDLGGSRYEPSGNDVWNYPGSKYGNSDRKNNQYLPVESSWIRRPGQDDCSVMSGQGFRLHKGVIRYAYNVPTVTECERMCFSENKFRCVTYSYRYSPLVRDNCLLCDRPVNLLDYYADVEPDRDFDLYSMADDRDVCMKTNYNDRQNNAQCFFRAIDTSRFFKSIVRDSLNVRSVGECEMECIKSVKFTCRAYAYRYGPKPANSIIDNCQLSDWPVRDMDKERHLVYDPAFDVFERASYGHGCEIQPIIDNKHKKLCYLGYGTPSKLLSSAIKKVISVSSELECKNECVRYRESTPFKCLSFSFGAHASSYNCEMSDLDQSELKLNVHYAHTTHDRDYWLFAWNPFDWTCRDKVQTIGGNRVNNDRRMDIFREPGQSTWTQFSVSGKPCRKGAGCEKNLVTGFYSCEIDGAGVGAWDYCCKTEHPCGYSQGFDYPWCFVGEGPDQWRTCSDRYFPSASTISKKKTSAAITYTPTSSSSASSKKKSDSYHQLPPRPGGLERFEEVAAARLWPVTYLYSSGPPNSTELTNFVDCDKENCQ